MPVTLYRFANKIIRLITPVKLNVLGLKQHIPGIVEMQGMPEYETVIAVISIVFIEKNKPAKPVQEIKHDDTHLHIYGHWNDTWVTDLPHLIYCYLKSILNKEELYPVHSCLINDTLFIGSSGSGKTTLCLEALRQNIPVYSTDKTILTFSAEDHLNRLIAIQGTDILSSRIVLHNVGSSYNQADRYLYNTTVSGLPLEVRQICFFKTTLNSKEFHKEKISGCPVAHQLYPFFIDQAKQDCFVQEGEILFSPGIESIIKVNLFKHLNTIKVPLWFIEGSIEHIIDFTKNGAAYEA